MHVREKRMYGATNRICGRNILVYNVFTWFCGPPLHLYTFANSAMLIQQYSSTMPKPQPRAGRTA